MSQAHGIALTFDDGPGPSTARLLDVLARHGARATFFVVGRCLQGEALGGDGERALALASRAVSEGHALGNHTMTHAMTLSPAALLDEIAECDALIRLIYARAGRELPAPPPVRLPFGPLRPDGPASLAALERAGRPHYHWSGHGTDWRAQRTPAQIADSLLRHVETAWKNERTAVLLLHDGGQTSGDGAEDGVEREATVNAVDLIAQRLQSRQPRYVTVHECEPARFRPATRRE
jgi:peptidoglycan/xylan/chitin deacetylase (PgdA/CDA1 family)